MSTAREFIMSVYAAGMRLYPHGFRTLFQEEMGEVFATALADAAESGAVALIRLCLRELQAWPLTALREHWFAILKL